MYYIRDESVYITGGNNFVASTSLETLSQIVNQFARNIKAEHLTKSGKQLLRFALEAQAEVLKIKKHNIYPKDFVLHMLTHTIYIRSMQGQEQVPIGYIDPILDGVTFASPPSILTSFVRTKDFDTNLKNYFEMIGVEKPVILSRETLIASGFEDVVEAERELSFTSQLHPRSRIVLSTEFEIRENVGINSVQDFSLIMQTQIKYGTYTFTTCMETSLYNLMILLNLIGYDLVGSLKPLEFYSDLQECEFDYQIVCEKAELKATKANLLLFLQRYISKTTVEECLEKLGFIVITSTAKVITFEHKNFENVRFKFTYTGIHAEMFIELKNAVEPPKLNPHHDYYFSHLFYSKYLTCTLGYFSFFELSTCKQIPEDKLSEVLKNHRE